MAEQGDIERVWKLMQKIASACWPPHDGKLIRGRPMAAHGVMEEDCIYFLTDAASHQGRRDRAANGTVALFFADTSGQKLRRGHGRGDRFQRPREDQGTVVDARQGLVGRSGRSVDPRG